MHVLHRLLAPRHPPYADTFLIFFKFKFVVFLPLQVLLTIYTLSSLFLCADFKERDLSLTSELTQASIREIVGLTGLEPVTPALSRRCSNQLSYRPFVLISRRGLHFQLAWWRHRDLNPGHPACKAGALPLSYTPVSLLVCFVLSLWSFIPTAAKVLPLYLVLKAKTRADAIIRPRR